MNKDFQANAQQIKSLGVLEFSDEGILFVGDNVSGAIHAFDFTTESDKIDTFEINVYNIDDQIAAVLGASQGSAQINDIAVHPKSGEVYLSVTRGHGIDALPALVKVDAANQIQNIDLSTLEITSQALNNVPDNQQRVALRGTGGAPTKKEIAKSKRSLGFFAYYRVVTTDNNSLTLHFYKQIRLPENRRRQRTR